MRALLQQSGVGNCGFAPGRPWQARRYIATRDACRRTRKGRMHGNSMIHGSEVGLILFRNLLMLLLGWSRR